MVINSCDHQLHLEDPDHVLVQENEADWWDVWDQDKVMELQVHTDKGRGPWAQLSLEDKKKLCEAIGYVEGGTRPDKPKQYIGEE
jgi:hypothetical protein